MASTLSKTGITDGGQVVSGHVTQSIDALTGAAAYNITISGSLDVDNAPITNLVAVGFISASGTITGNTVSANTYVGLPSGIISGSTQLPSGLISSSLHVFTNITASGAISASSTISAFGSSSLHGLPTSKPTITGSLWLSGSAGEGSKYLVVFTG
jgi:hypothetical protein